MLILSNRGTTRGRVLGEKPGETESEDKQAACKKQP
jgi:hypothetical protein